MDNFNPTQVLGLISFGSAAVLCARAARHAGAGQTGWGVLAGIYILLVLEVLFGGRFIVSDTFRDVLRSLALYQDRGALQTQVIPAFVLLVGSLGIWILVRYFRTAGPIRLAHYATLATVLLFGVETLSLHSVDALLYRATGPALLIGWLWLGLATLTAWSAIAAARA